MLTTFRNISKDLFNDEYSVLVFPDSDYKFDKTDGIIEYINFAMQLLLKDKKNVQFRKLMFEMYRLLNNLKDKNVRYNTMSHSEANYEEYREHISTLADYPDFDDKVEIIFETTRSGCKELYEDYSSHRNLFCLVYGDMDEYKASVHDDLVDSMITLNLHKTQTMCNESSLYMPGYHVAVFDALTYLLQTFQYAFNCESYKKDIALVYDINHITQYLNISKNILKNVKP
jgi:hypothetical protein